MAHRNEDGRELERALSQNGDEVKDLSLPEEPILYTESESASSIEKEKRLPASRKQSVYSNLEKVETTATNFTDASDAVPEVEQPKEKVSWHRRYNPLRRGKVPPVPEERTVSREYNASFLSLLTFQWINPLMTVGYKRHIELNDIWLVNPDRSSETMINKLMKSFKERSSRQERNPLMWALFDTFKPEFLLGGVCALFSALFQVFSPFTTRYLITYATNA